MILAGRAALSCLRRGFLYCARASPMGPPKIILWGLSEVMSGMRPRLMRVAISSQEAWSMISLVFLA